MREPIYTIHRDVAYRSGIAVRYCAQIYADKIRVFSPGVPYESGWPYNLFMQAIKSTDNTITLQEVVDSVLGDMERDKATDDGHGEAAAWSKLADQLGFSYLEYSIF